jgi:LysR family transcriptional repressor of citA
MELRDLITFQVAAQHLNFHQAAKELYVTQPAITLRIQALEEELGHKLFERDGRQLLLTEAANIFKPFVDQMLSTLDRGLKELVYYQQGQKGELHLGGDGIVNAYLMPELLQKFISDHPETRVTVHNLPSAQVVQQVREGNIHVGVIRIKPQTDDLTSLFLTNDEVKLVSRPVESDSIPDRFEELCKAYPLVVNKSSWYWQMLSSHFEVLETLPTRIEGDHVEMIKRFILQGMGMGFLPMSSMQEELAGGQLVILPTTDIQFPPVPVYLIYKERNDILHMNVQRLVQFIIRHVGSSTC